MKLWIVILVVGALNYLSRLSFIAFFANRSVPPMLARALKFVPAAMLTALLVPMVLAPADGALVASNPRVPAAIVALAVALFTHSTLWTLVAGMAVLHGLRLLF